MRGLISSLLFSFIALSLPQGCSEGNKGKCIEGPAAFSDTPLPEAFASGFVDCTDAPEPPTVEVWAGAADSVLIGTVMRICPCMEPAAVMINDADPPYVSESECTGLIEGGVEITLIDVETLYGKDLGSEVTVTLGAELVQEYSPTLMVFSDRPMMWPPGDKSRIIEPGQRIGGAMYIDPDWGFIGPQKNGVFFQEDGEGNARFQEYENKQCYAPVPVGIDGIPLEELRDVLSSLDLSDPAVQQAIEIRKTWYNDKLGRLSQYWGAKCFPGPDCSKDSDCTDGEICRDGFCGPECVTDYDCGANELCTDGQCKEL